MRVSCIQKNLAKGLSVVGRAVATKSTLPVVSNVLLATDQSRLKLAATNLEIAITCWIGATIEDEGTITVPARLYSELINSMPNEQVDLNLNARNQSLNVRCNRYEANIKGIDAEEFPPIPAVGHDTKMTADPKSLREAIGQVVFAAATDDTRPVLAGVLCRFRGDTLTMAAADGFRLSVRTLKLSSPAPSDLDVIVPARALNELARILADEEEEAEPVEITITPNKAQALFHVSRSTGDIMSIDLVSRLIEGTFPNYQQIIPRRDDTTKAQVGTADFQKATKVASFFARDASNVIRLSLTAGEELTPGQLTVAATAAEVGDTTTAIESIIEGNNTQIAFNAKYLSDVLSVIDEPRVLLEVTSPSSPGVFRPASNEDFVHVIMPMHTASR